MPTEDIEVTGLFSKYHQHFKSPLKLADVLSTELGTIRIILAYLFPVAMAHLSDFLLVSK